MSAEIREAKLEDVAALIDLMQHAHAEGGFVLNREIALAAFTALLNDRSHGAAWIALRDQKPEGYLVLTFKLSMESGGLDAFIEDIVVYRDARRSGVGSALMTEAIAECRRTGISAVHVEIGAGDEAAKSFYARCGLKNRGHTILTVALRENLLARPL